jgi:hypothetical protein
MINHIRSLGADIDITLFRPQIVMYGQVDAGFLFNPAR